ncbi:MAG: methanogen output domain 1-containing protein [Methanosarcinaceae archaeon]|nr:methanogen output domain 1-containing protein [Methanosarcinaceae archaeon]MDD4497317.1 methanogen output domain 1-containing protein [Methanosarcinaceae archaeon]
MDIKRTPKVLIVDDMPQNVELMEAFLATEPYELIRACDGKEALQQVKYENPDIVLLDVMMPVMDGFEVCRILKNDINTQFIPVLMLTALSELNDRIKGIDAGADDFLTKPINSMELKTRVKSLLRVKCLHDRLVMEKNALAIQNKVRSILTAILPTLLQSLHPEQKKIIINQMTGMVEKTVLEMYQLDEKELTLSEAGKICADIMNQLGGSFVVREIEEGCRVIGTSCPWGTEDARRNPILCTLTRKIFSSVISKLPGKWGVDTVSTIGNRDECCDFRIKRL